MIKLQFTSTRACVLAVASTAILLASCGGGSGSTTVPETGSLPETSTSSPNPAASQTSTPSQDTVPDPTPAPAPEPAPAPTPAPTPEPSPAPAPAPAPTAPGPYGQDASQYNLAFNEDFNSFNTSVWNDHIWYEGSNATKNFTVENGVLKVWLQRDASGNFFNRTLDTDGKYYQTYGYFEMEAKLPYGKGAWPAFWLFNHDGSTRPEIDIMEAYSGGGPSSGWSDSSLHPTNFAATIWPDGIQAGWNAGSKKLGETLGMAPDLSAGFHKYAVKWEPNKISFYFDGKLMYSSNTAMPNRMYIILDLWIGSASGNPDNSTPTGKTNSYEVNYVRAWTFK